MKFNRRPYQKLITAHIMRHARCNIFATMGSGKTGSVMWSLNKLFQTGELEDWDAETETGDRVLILAPLRVASGTWPAEQQQFQKLQLLKLVSFS
jgi:Lhr-like helicase